MIEIQKIKPPKIIGLVLFSSLMFSLWPTFGHAEVPAAVRVAVEGVPLAMPVAPIIVEDRTMVGVRSVGEAVGGELTWDQATRKVTVVRRSDTVVMTVGSRWANVNGKAVELPVAPQIVADRTMVPLRFIAEALGGTVEWNNDTRVVNILRKPSAVSAMTYTNSPDKGWVVLSLSEPLVRVTPKVTGNTVSLDLYPATVTAGQPDRRIGDGLVQELHLQGDGRVARLTAQLSNPTNFRYIVAPDGNQLTVEFDHNVTGYQVQQENRISTVLLQTTGKLPYTAFALANPARVVVDFPGVHLAPGVTDSAVLTNPYVTRVRTADRGADGVRVVLDMKESVPYDIQATDNGLQVQFLPRIEAVKTERLQGKTRLTLAGTLPMDARVTALPEQKQLRVEIPQGKSGIAGNVVKPADGTVDSVTVAPGAAPNSSVVTIALPYYLGHTVVSNNGDRNVVIDLVSSPVYGKRIWIDAGHGRIPGAKDDPGSIGKVYGTQEKIVNLAVALELQKRLQAAGANVFMTRTGDSGVDFTQRPALVNALKPPVDLFISVHHNSASQTSVRGIETYYWSTNPKSRTVAQLLHPAIVTGLGFPDRGVRTDSFYVIKETRAPSVLLELGYLSNGVEEKAIAEPGAVIKTYPAKAAEAIKNGVFNYFWQEIRSGITK